MSTPRPVAAETKPDAAQRRADALRRAAQAKRHNATARAEAAIRRLVKDQQEITFRSIARAGGVSIDFLYANPDLRRRIDSLRSQQSTVARARPDPGAAPASAEGTLVQTLTAKLRDERTAYRAAVGEFEQQLAACHGEIIRLRRALQQHGIQADVTDASATS
jgi:hypothetical protein